jgi:hypothetical protein
MKNLKTLNGIIILNRSQQKRIFSGGEQTLGLDSESKCSNTGCEGKRAGESCVIGNYMGKCEDSTCAGTIQLLCFSS